MIRNRLQWLNTLVSEPYYLFHFLIFFSYLPIRISAAFVFSPFMHDRLLHREIQGVLAFAVFTMFKMVREESFEPFIADTLFFGKIFLLVFALFLDYHLALWYLVAFVVIYILTQQPNFPVLGSAKALTPLQLEATLTEGDASRFWLVEFRVLSLSTCAQASSIFPELSITYSNKNLSFGVVDLGLFPNAGAKFGISIPGSTPLPTYILYEKNVEVSRYPDIDFELKASNPPISKTILARHFELDKQLINYVNGR